jgi:hypothetical protein
MSWLSGWDYRKSHVINQASNAGTGYQISLTVHYGSGSDSGADVYLNSKCEMDFGDIRFTDDDGSTELDYWMEEKTNSDNAKFWVKVNDDLGSSDVTIYVYYGNDQATYPYGDDQDEMDATFLFADHFYGADIDSNKWDEQDSDGSYSVSGSVLTVSSPSFGNHERIVSDDEFSNNKAIMWGNLYVSGSGPQTYLYGEWRNFGSIDLYAVQTYGSADYRVAAYNTDYASQSITDLASPHDYCIGWRASDIKCYIDNALETTISSQITSTNKKASFYADNGWIKCDWVAIRKYVYPEPQNSTWGEEEGGAPPDRIEANFETGDTSEFDDTPENNGDVTVTSDVAHHGTYSCKCDVNANGGSYAEGFFDIDAQQPVYCRGYFRFNQLPETDRDYTIISFENTSGPTTVGYIQLVDESGTKKWKMRRTTSGGTAYATSTVDIPDVDIWVCVEFAHGEGLAKLWVDGKEILAYNDATTQTIDRVHVGACDSDIDADDTLEIHLDCIVVTDDYVGPDLEINNLTINETLKLECDVERLSKAEIVNAIYKWENDEWVPEGLPADSTTSKIMFKDNIEGLYGHLFSVISTNVDPPEKDPLLVTDVGMVVQKDLAVGGFISTNQGEIWIGHGRHTSTDPPRIVLMHTRPIYSNPEYDTLYLTKFDCSTLANMNLEKLIVANEANISKQENMVRYSQEFSNEVWGGCDGNKTNITNAETAPDGTATATKIDTSISGGCNGCYQSVNPSLQADETYTMSIWLKGASGDEQIVIGLNDDYTTTVTLTEQWVRYDYTATPESGKTTRGLQFYCSTTDATYYVYGAQLEKENSVHGYSKTTVYPIVKRLALKSQTGVTAVLDLDGLMGTLDASNVFVDNINCLSGQEITIYPSIVFNSGIKSSINPTDDDTYGLGSGSYRWQGIVALTGYFDEIQTTAGGTYVWNLANMPNQGTNGYVLTAQGAGNPPIWAPAGAGSVPWTQVPSSINPITDNTYGIGSGSYAWQGVVAYTMYADHYYARLGGNATFHGNVTGNANYANTAGYATPYSHTHAASDVTSGTFALARIPSGLNSKISWGYIGDNPTPSANDTYSLGNGSYYWHGLVANYVYYKNLSSFDALDDLALLKKYTVEKKTVKQGDEEIEIDVIAHDSLDFLKRLKENDSEEDFWDGGKVMGYLLGCLKSEVLAREKLEQTVKELTTEIAKQKGAS